MTEVEEGWSAGRRECNGQPVEEKKIGHELVSEGRTDREGKDALKEKMSTNAIAYRIVRRLSTGLRTSSSFSGILV